MTHNLEKLSADSSQAAILRVLNAIEAVKSGRMVIMVDDEGRENEGDLVLASEFVSPAMINFMAKEARGLICLTLTPEDVDRLPLPLMGDRSKSATPMGTAFTVSIEAKSGVTTGISAHDRSHTIKVATDPNSKPEDIVVPGHIFPLRAKHGGVLERAGHTEGSIDLMKLSGLSGSSVICEIMNDDGTMARRPELEAFAEKHGLMVISIEDLITYRLRHELLIEPIEKQPIKTPFGTFDGLWYRNKVDQSVHFALIKGWPFLESDIVDVRVHKQRPIGDIFIEDITTNHLSGRAAVDYGLKMLQSNTKGVLLYLVHDDFKSAIVQEISYPKGSAMDPRLYGIGAQILHHLGVRRMQIHVNADRPLIGLNAFDLEIVKTIKPKG